MMKLAFIIAFIIALIIYPVTASDFIMTSEDFGSVLLRNIISGVNTTQLMLKVLTLANNTNEVQTTGYMFQNLWGIIYGALVVTSWQNEIGRMILVEIGNNTTNLNLLGEAINALGSNSTIVFGDSNGSSGFSRILNGMMAALNNSSRLYQGKSFLEAYAESISLFSYELSIFLIELSKAIPRAFI